MIEKIDKQKCTGCKMCADICPKDAISFETDNQGFWYPHSDSQKCINCGLCVNTCIVSKPLTVNTNRIAYSAYSRNDKIRREAASGGVYYELATEMLKLGGYLVGSVYSDDFYSAYHIASNNKEDLPRIMGSKYFQSDTAGIYKKTKHLLEDNQKVLFTGLPCQVHALKVYLKKDYENLITLDLLCRGVPSPAVHMKKIQSYEEKAKCKVKFFKDKGKNVGWENFGEYIEFKNGKTRFISRWKDPINDCFIVKNLNIRESCYNCIFKDGNSASDLSTGDFWGIKEHTEKDSIYGVSCLIANTEKGDAFINSINKTLYLNRVNLESIRKGNPAYLKAIDRPKNRDKFYEMIEQKGINYTVKHINKHSLKQQVHSMLSRTKKKLKPYKFFIKNFFNIKLLQFIKLNYFSKNVIRSKEFHIFPMRGTLLQISKGGIIDLQGNLYLNHYPSYKHRHSETLLKIGNNGKLIVTNTVIIAHGNTISIANNATLETGYLRTGINNNIICAKKMTFGQRVMLARNVCIFDSDFHPIYNSNFDKINEDKEVIIGDNCWIGANSMILKGSILNNGCIIGANSMVIDSERGGGNIESNKIFVNKREPKYVGDTIFWKI